MKAIKIPVLIIVPLIIMTSSSLYNRQDRCLSKSIIQDTILKYSDGVFEGQSQDKYTDEPYWGKVQVKIEKGSFSVVSFVIRDSNLHETFDQFYEKHFIGTPEYVQQCRNDWKGVQIYPGRLLESQNINKVDAMSGATWSYNIFKASANKALMKAVK